MGREIKRVPLDFDWPRNKVWQGYLMPDSLRPAPCPAGEACDNGRTAARVWVETLTHMLLMLDDDLNDQHRDRNLHPYFGTVPGGGHYGTSPRPSADIREFGTGLAGRDSNGIFGHDAIDRWRATEKIVAAAGLDAKTWGYCPACGGAGAVEAYPGQEAEADAWEMTEPPAGEGWQLWETVSEGSPISPVFADAEGLAQWLTTPDSCWGATRRPMTIEQARGFVGVGWAPSGFITAGGVHDGAEYVGTAEALRGHEGEATR